MRELVLGAMPKGATPSTHIASGPWCFSNQEKDFPFWDGDFLGNQIPTNTHFPLPSDPFPYDAKSFEHNSIDFIAKSANYEVLKWIKILQREFNVFFSVEYSEKFWTMALGSWLLLTIHMLAERQKRMTDIVDLYAHEPIIVRLLPKDCTFSFTSSHDFMIHGVQDREFNHYIFSRIIESIAPKNWKITYFPQKELTPKNSIGNKSSYTIIRTFFKEKALPFLQNKRRLLLFPWQKNIGLSKSILFSLALSININRKDMSTPFNAYVGSAMPWVFDVDFLVRKIMPTSITNQCYLPSIPKVKGKLRGMTAAISQDDRYRFALAAWLEGGGKLFSVQHGANYGNLRVMGGSIFEYMQHAFITWGWNSHKGYAINAFPLPLQDNVNKLQRKNYFSLPSGKSAPLLLVGTEMSPYSYRLKSRPMAKAQVEYRQSKISFLHNLPAPFLERVQYRPYFPVKYGLDDASYVTQYFPQVSLCKGDLTKHLRACRLLILDHYGTTLLTALSANIPTLCFWNPLHWGFDEESSKILHRLEKVGVWHPTPEQAAKAVAENGDTIEEWWNQDCLQKVRKEIIHLYADYHAGIFPNVTWFKALTRL